MRSALRDLLGGLAGFRKDGLAEVRVHLDALKSRGGPEVEAHAHRNANRDELAVSELAGCFYCCSVFPPTAIEEWVDNGRCAMCPKCGIDSVIGSASGFPIGDERFLQRMREIWF